MFQKLNFIVLVMCSSLREQYQQHLDDLARHEAQKRRDAENLEQEHRDRCQTFVDEMKRLEREMEDTRVLEYSYRDWLQSQLEVSFEKYRNCTNPEED